MIALQTGPVVGGSSANTVYVPFDPFWHVASPVCVTATSSVAAESLQTPQWADRGVVLVGEVFHMPVAVNWTDGPTAPAASGLTVIDCNSRTGVPQASSTELQPKVIKKKNARCSSKSRTIGQQFFSASQRGTHAHEDYKPVQACLCNPQPTCLIDEGAEPVSRPKNGLVDSYRSNPHKRGYSTHSPASVALDLMGGLFP